MSLTSMLPKPQHAPQRVEEEALEQKQQQQQQEQQQQQQASGHPEPPAYGQRNGWVPREPRDFGDGGAFPEIHVLQYPLDMGRKDKKRVNKGAVVSLQVDAEGNVTYDAVLRQNMRKDMRLYSHYTDLLEKDMSENDLRRPSAEEEAKVAEKTRKALGQLVDSKTAAARASHVKTNTGKEPTFIRYTPSQQSAAHNSGAKQRIIRLQEMPVDPLEPPKFKHTKVPGGPPSPPPPVMHSPPRKITVQDQQNWKIPPCISNWKNIKGYTIPLDKRLASDGRGLQEVQINDKFAKLSESLFIAERTARKEIRERAKMTKDLMKKNKEAKEAELRRMAAQARAAVMDDDDEDDDDEMESERDIEARDKRDELRKERSRDLRRELRMEAMADDKRKGKNVGRDDADRDISEQIALGKSTGKSKDLMFDQRLFNQDQGMGAGFGGDDSYGVYDKPLFKGQTSNYIYRAKEGLDDGSAQGDLTKILEKSTSRFTAGERGFKGTEDGARPRDKPVAFEKEDNDDPYGLGETFKESDKPRDTLDKIGKRGFMGASAGGSRLDAEEDKLHDHSGKSVEFREGSSSSSSSSRRRSRSRSRSRGRSRRGSRRSRSRSPRRDRRR